MTLVVQRPCSDGSSDPCCQSRPECKFAFVRELRNAKPQGASEPRLILIQRAERTSSKSEGRSNMQDVQGTSAEEPGLGSGNPPGMRKSRGRYRHDTDQAVVHILGKRKQNSLLLRSAQLLPENAPIERVDELEFGEVGGEERWPDALHDCCGRGGVGVGDEKREEEAGVRVDDQKRSRAAASCSAPETFRRFLPKTFFCRARKSGKAAGAAGSGGSSRAMTRLRLVMWISSPSRSRSSTAENR